MVINTFNSVAQLQLASCKFSQHL